MRAKISHIVLGFAVMVPGADVVTAESDPIVELMPLPVEKETVGSDENTADCVDVTSNGVKFTVCEGQSENGYKIPNGGILKVTPGDYYEIKYKNPEAEFPMNTKIKYLSIREGLQDKKPS